MLYVIYITKDKAHKPKTICAAFAIPKLLIKNVNTKNNIEKKTIYSSSILFFVISIFIYVLKGAGKIEDSSQLEQLIQEIGQKAFREDKRQGRVKEPDMIGDFIATQWFLWDSISSIQSTEGVSMGQTWQSKLSVPTPMVLRKARDVTYRLDEIRQSKQGQLAVIHSSYKLAESVPKAWPIPYSGRFEVAGPFGFYINYEVLDLQGKGEELFNIDAGRIEQYNQQYRMQLEASFPLALGINPRITIKQNLTMQLLE